MWWNDYGPEPWMYFGPAFFIVMIFACGVMMMYMTRGYRGGNRIDSAAQTLKERPADAGVLCIRSCRFRHARSAAARQTRARRKSGRRRPPRSGLANRPSREGVRVSRRHHLSRARPTQGRAVLAHEGSRAAKSRRHEGHRRGRVAAARCGGAAAELSPGEAVPAPRRTPHPQTAPEACAAQEHPQIRQAAQHQAAQGWQTRRPAAAPQVIALRHRS